MRDETDPGDLPRRLNTAWERRTIRTAAVFALIALPLLLLIGLALRPGDMPAWLIALLSVVGAFGVYVWMSRRVRRRREILAKPFPVEWEEVLQREVVFYRSLDPEDRQRFRNELQAFLGEKRITGIKTEVDTTTGVLAAASAIIPIFGFPEWEWDQISEILVYPSRYNKDYSFDEGDSRHTLGQVGTGAMNRLMILSKPDLLQGFRNPGDKRNVGLHEFAHLVDKSDGSIDGLPGVGIDRKAVGPWIDLVRRKMEEIRRGDSDIDEYALTNEAEFFAVATEYFFERPGIMRQKHPELYAMLAKVFQQDLGARLQAIRREMSRGRPTFGRNSPCPCGSGVKYKKCCLRRGV